MSNGYMRLVRSDTPSMIDLNKRISQEESVGLKSRTRIEMNKGSLLDTLYRKYWDSLCTSLRMRYGNGPPDPEDVAQVTFERVSRLEGLESIHNPRGFLITIAGRIFIDETRRRGVSDKYIDEQLKIYGVVVEEITPERVYNAREEFKIILQDLNEFSSQVKEVVLRHRVLGQTYDEISKATGLSPASISRYLKAAMITIFKKKADQLKYEKGE
ncbi:RNA polymerase sigma factor [Paremcibacter congregatus]|uniref:RNA polymerase subunit sigma-70 n=1 Tax=Paremcibacter congregatus TaxID=2043170 RepID=A0A2G4YW42_9PROT|nr:sigma-70 family RNA polymerase sigma factor [Paremcibacter congregatus]PHZ86557.1 hypothetical protein CRD36_01355 [Paremcibacter congregatus]QDE26362.1 sigma-70 family RNA polymerase sigma factor [Paremcibacter congregatus]